MESGSGSRGLGYPKQAFFILFGYLLERFVYYGLFGAVVFYMQRMLGFSAASANTTKAVIESFIYLAPIPGAILADVWLGKVRTVFLMCCGYTVGAFIYTLSSVTPIMSSVEAAKATGIIGLLVLGLCAGLMKAVYSSLGADQFIVPEQREQQKRFFYAFYWMINAGAFAGQFLTAQLRDQVQCFGNDCYFLPYGILVFVMIFSTLIFTAGRSRYISSPPDTMLVKAIKCIGYAIRKSWDDNRKPVEHWLYRAQDKYEYQLIQDIQLTLRVLVLFCSWPLFWCLFYQSSTGMIFQAKRLDPLIGDYKIPPELSSAINPFLILTLIPLFNFVIYPCLNRLNYMTSNTSRMIVGMCFAVAAFICYAVINMQVEQPLISADHSSIHIYNNLPCKVDIGMNYFNATLENGTEVLTPEILHSHSEVMVSIVPSCTAPDMEQVMVAISDERETTLLISESGAKIFPATLEYIKSEDAEAKVRFLSSSINNTDITLQYKTLKHDFILEGGMTDFQEVSPQDYEVMINGASIGIAKIVQDGVYDVVVSDSSLSVFPVTAPSNLHLFVMFPQYILLTIGEILFSVSGMDFAYSEAPPAMKSTLQASNLFTISVGLWFFAALESISASTGMFRHRPSQEAFLYASLMAANTFIFILLIRRYNKKNNTSTNNDKYSSEGNENIQSQKAGIDNESFATDEYL